MGLYESFCLEISDRDYMSMTEGIQKELSNYKFPNAIKGIVNILAKDRYNLLNAPQHSNSLVIVHLVCDFSLGEKVLGFKITVI